MTDRTLRRLATAALVAYLVLLVADAVPSSASATGTSDWGLGGWVGAVPFAVFTTLFPLMGWAVLRGRPRNRIGWLLMAIGGGWAVTYAVDVYASVDVGGPLPGAALVAAFGSGTWAIPIILTGVHLLLLFPDGRLPSPRWRIVAWAGAVAVVLVVVVVDPGLPTNAGLSSTGLPLGLLHHLQYVLVPLVPGSILAAAVSVVVRFRRARGIERLQLKWLVAAAAGSAVVYVASVLASLPYTIDRPPTWVLVLQTAGLFFIGTIPVAIGVAITRHGLYGIDRLINRALVVGALGAFITAVYVAVVVGIGAVVGRQGSLVLSVVATAAVAIAFQPVRERVQRLANRLVYGRRATPYEVLSDFATNLSGTYTTGELLPRLARTLSESLGGARTAVWVRDGEGLAREAVWPADDRGDLTAADESDPVLAADRVLPVRHRDETLGVLGVSKPSGERMTPPEDALLEQVASQAGLVLRNVRLLDDLKRSRERLVATQDETRRKLERNLHDGAQQSLVSVNLLVRMAANRAQDARLEGALTEAAAGLQTAIDQVRELARGIHPAVLTERGLTPALTSLAERSRIPVTVQTTTTDRAATTVETTLYVVAAEALTNAARHSGATSVVLTLTREDDDLVLAVTDDGRGGADPDHGTGLRGLTDRVAVADGALDLHSPPGGGTRITCRIPCPVPTTPEPVLEPAS